MCVLYLCLAGAPHGGCVRLSVGRTAHSHGGAAVVSSVFHPPPHSCGCFLRHLHCGDSAFSLRRPPSQNAAPLLRHWKPAVLRPVACVSGVVVVVRTTPRRDVRRAAVHHYTRNLWSRRFLCRSTCFILRTIGKQGRIAPRKFLSGEKITGGKWPKSKLANNKNDHQNGQKNAKKICLSFS